MQLATDAVVLHAFDYMESSRIVRLATRDAGLVSVLARGVRRPRSRFGGSLDLYTGGTAQLSLRPGRDLQTLTAFEVTRSRHQLAGDLTRFTAAAAFAELVLRFMGDQPEPTAFDIVAGTLDTLALAAPEEVPQVVLGGSWHLVGELGFAPSVDQCASCGAPVPDDRPGPFSHTMGGVLCAACASRSPGGRALPPQARRALLDWLQGGSHALTDTAEVAAHQRLLRLFIQSHLAGGRPLPAFELWEKGLWR